MIVFFPLGKGVCTMQEDSAYVSRLYVVCVSQSALSAGSRRLLHVRARHAREYGVRNEQIRYTSSGILKTEGIIGLISHERMSRARETE